MCKIFHALLTRSKTRGNCVFSLHPRTVCQWFIPIQKISVCKRLFSRKIIPEREITHIISQARGCKREKEKTNKLHKTTERHFFPSSQMHLVAAHCVHLKRAATVFEERK